MIETSPLFPERVNVEFVRVRDKEEMDFRVWERGSGITQACGTGACAAVVASVLNGYLEQGAPVTVHLLGGDLEIVWAADSHVYMKGPAEFIMDGEFYL
jgi:diaminopimelate epimerase